MQALILLLSALSATLATGSATPNEARQANAASVDRFAGPGCTGTICNKAGAGDLSVGCNEITDSCRTSLKLTGVDPGCRVTLWADATCTSNRQFLNVTDFDCKALGPPINSISVDC